MKEPEIVGKYTQLVFECTVCKKVFKKPGICSECQLLLKVGGG